MKIIIWGVGERGKRIFSRLKPEEVIAFIDNDEKKIGKKFKGKEIISLQEYLDYYSHYFILISLLRPDAVKRQLEEKGVFEYMDSLDCPSELQGISENKSFDGYIASLAKGKSYGIYGTAFYSLFFYERLKKGECKEIYLVPEIDVKQERINKIKNSFNDVNILTDISYVECLDKIFVAKREFKEAQALFKKTGNLEVENVFDLSRNIPQYKNERIVKFKNIHKNERCFIVATGPSLRLSDLHRLKDNHEKSISMNRVFLVFEQTEWRPDYYVVTDQGCIEESGEEIKLMPVPNKFVSDTYEPFWEGNIPSNVYKYHAASMPRAPFFSDNLIYGCYSTGTVTYECIQWAAYMGFKEIYLLGVDFSFSSNYKDACNHFIKNYYTKDSKAIFFADKESLQAYMSAREYADKNGIKIYNATRGGKLEVFDRVDFDSLF
jgi:Protein of unknown function DUF115.